MTTDRLRPIRLPRRAPGLLPVGCALLGALLLWAPVDRTWAEEDAATGPPSAGNAPAGTAAEGGAATAPPTEVVPVGRPIQLDGHVVPAEWSPAIVLSLGDGKSSLRLMQYRGTLLAAFESAFRWTPGATLTLYFAQPEVAGGALGQGASYIAFEPFNHDRPHVVAYHNGADGFVSVIGQVVIRSSLSGRGSSAELALPLSLLGLTQAEHGPLRFAVAWTQPNARGAAWPIGLDFLGKARGRPPALASTSGWGTLEGWGDPSGPGAFSKQDWAAWTAADQELSNRGRAAHDEVKLLIEEWKHTSKRDKELQKNVLDEFAWLATKERLTAKDLLRQATVLRFLNRHDSALGLLDGLVNHPERGPAKRARWIRAMTLEAAQKYEAAALDWDQRALDSQGSARSQNAERAAWARKQAQAWLREQAARAEDTATNNLPQVALHTNRGTILIELFERDVPHGVAQFLSLVGEKFYDGTCFHRVHGEFMAQGGDPKTRELGCSFGGNGSSGREIEVEKNARHGLWRGAVAYAHKAHDPRNGSQFFLMTAPRPGLDAYTVFGHILAGQRVADRLEWGDKILRAEIVRPSTPRKESPPPKEPKEPEEPKGPK